MARRPYSGRTTSPYGPRLAPIKGASTFHAGLDGIGDYYNRAPEAGVVVWYGYNGGWGNLIKFRGDSGTVHYLAHNAPGGLVAPVGSRQAEGAALGVKGMTGTATGVHVHWETRPGGGSPIDPEAWLRSQGGTAGGGATPIDLETFTEKGNTMLAMNRPQDNVIAVFGDDELGPYWQEIHYLASAKSGSPLEVTTRYVIGLTHSVPVVDYDDTGWNYRSNHNPAFKRDIFTIKPDGTLEFKAHPAGQAGAPGALADADIDRIAKAVIKELKLPGN